ncbi:uncharacterized protein DNG_00509 [Cephalotrichum gorgonifer]|uniref:Uncharacterized protein n=1 Tax=Cephalotrichum gorgonifer TaxID=2041049 RepID=A0AAE8MPB3_9PEZI|nr:uncharacterized protein DNG_00509 [Cephalotrichum gorgonifer]
MLSDSIATLPRMQMSDVGRSRFHEDFDAPFFEHIINPAVTPTTEPNNSTPYFYQPTGSSESAPLLLMSPRSTWSSSSWKSTTSDVIKGWARYPIKKIREGTTKLSRLGTRRGF